MTTTVIFAAVIVRIILVNFTTSSEKDWRGYFGRKLHRPSQNVEPGTISPKQNSTPNAHLDLALFLSIAEDTPCTLAVGCVRRVRQMYADALCTHGKRRDLCLGSIWWYAGCCNTAVCKEMSKMALLKHEPGAAQKATILYNCIHLLKLGWIDVDILELFEEFAAFAWYAYLQVPQHCPTVNISKVIHSAFTAV